MACGPWDRIEGRMYLLLVGVIKADIHIVIVLHEGVRPAAKQPTDATNVVQKYSPKFPQI